MLYIPYVSDRKNIAGLKVKKKNQSKEKKLKRRIVNIEEEEQEDKNSRCYEKIFYHIIHYISEYISSSRSLVC